MPTIRSRRCLGAASLTTVLSSGLPVLLLLLLSCCLATTTTFYADGAVLPTTIISAPYISIDDSTNVTEGKWIEYVDGIYPIGGTTLDVPAMLADAASKGLPEAVFDATRLTFNGTLNISLPATADAWLINNVSLRVVIRDGMSYGVPYVHINLQGVLAYGSSITVLGGNYNISTFMLTPSITIQNGSSVSLTGGGTYLSQGARGRITTSSVLLNNGLFSVSSSSTFTVSNNIVMLAPNADWNYFLLYTIAAVNINASSRLSIDNNTISASSFKGYTYQWCTMRAFGKITVTSWSTLSVNMNNVSLLEMDSVQGSTYQLYLSLGEVDMSSAISVSHNSLAVYNMNMSRNTDWVHIIVHIYQYSTTVSPTRSIVGFNSTFSVNNNSVLMSSNKAFIYTIAVATVRIWGSLQLVGGDSTFSISNNNITMMNLQAGNRVTVPKDDVRNSEFYVLDVQKDLDGYQIKAVTVENGTFNISSNTMSFLNVKFGYNMYTYTVNIGLLTVNKSSAFLMSNNEVHATYVSWGWTWTVNVLYANAVSVQSSSSLSIFNNAHMVTNVSGGSQSWRYVMYVQTLTTVDTNSTLPIHGNRMTAMNVDAGGSSNNAGAWLVLKSGSLALANDSTMSIRNNVINSSGHICYTGVLAPTTLFAVGTLHLISANIQSHSKYIVANNTFTFVKSDFGVGLEIVVVMLANILNVDDVAISFEITGNKVDVSNCTALKKLMVICSFVGFLSPTFAPVIVAHNTFTFSNIVGDKGATAIKVYMHAYQGTSYATLPNNFSLFNNSVGFSNITSVSSVESIVLYFYQSITALPNSTISIFNNKMMFSGVRVESSLTAQTAFVLSSLSLSSPNISFTVTNNSVWLDTVQVGSLITTTTLGSNIIHVGDSNTLVVSGNKIHASNIVAGSSWRMSELNVDGMVTLENRGTISVTHNDAMLPSNISVNSLWSRFVVSMSGKSTTRVLLNTSGVLEISHNTLMASKMNVSGTLEAGALSSSSSFTLLANSSYTVYNNTMDLSDSTVGVALSTYVVSVIPLAVNGSSVFTVVDNALTVSNVVAKSTSLYIASIKSATWSDDESLTIGSGVLNITNNKMSLTNSTSQGDVALKAVWMYAKTVTISDTGIVSISKNKMIVSNFTSLGDVLGNLLQVSAPESFDISATSTFILTDNDGLFTHVNTTGQLDFYSVYIDSYVSYFSSHFSVSERSNFTITNNNVTMVDVAVSGAVDMDVINMISTYNAKKLTIVDPNYSTFSVTSNTMSLTDVNASSSVYLDLYRTIIFPNTTIANNNTAAICNVYTYNGYLCSSSCVSPTWSTSGTSTSCNAVPTTPTTTTTTTTTATSTSTPTTTTTTTTMPPKTVIYIVVEGTIDFSTLLTDIKSGIGKPYTTAVGLSCPSATNVTTKTCTATFDSADDAATIKRMVEENKIPGAMSASYEGNSPAPPSNDDDDDSTVIIVVCVVVGVLVLVGAGVGAAVFLRRRGSSSGYSLEDNEMALNDPSDHHNDHDL